MAKKTKDVESTDVVETVEEVKTNVCATCNGTGRHLPDQTCPACEGTGVAK